MPIRNADFSGVVWPKQPWLKQPLAQAMAPRREAPQSTLAPFMKKARTSDEEAEEQAAMEREIEELPDFDEEDFDEAEDPSASSNLERGEGEGHTEGEHKEEVPMEPPAQGVPMEEHKEEEVPMDPPAKGVPMEEPEEHKEEENPMEPPRQGVPREHTEEIPMEPPRQGVPREEPLPIEGQIVLGGPPPLKTLEEFMQMNFWDILDLPRGTADQAAIARAHRKIALRYHPDKGGDHRVFVFIEMVVDTLSNPEKRSRYEAEGGNPFTEPFTGNDSKYYVKRPPINEEFLKQLSKMQGAYDIGISNRLLVDYFNAMLDLDFKRGDHRYEECKLAKAIDAKLRMVPFTGECPVYSTPRIVRNACFMGVPVQELDFPASHGQQMYKYAREHDLPRQAVEEAFGDTAKIAAYRTKASHGLPAKTVKHITNMLVYGAGAKKLPTTELPEDLKKLKAEIGRVREDMWERAPEPWRVVVALRKHPKLTMCSIYCQLGERVDLDKVTAKLATECYGYLGDSVLTDSGMDSVAFCAAMAVSGIYVTVKKFPQTPAEYFELLKGEGYTFTQSALTKRQSRRLRAYKMALSWLIADKGKGPMPHLEFAIAIEERLPTAYNPFTKKTEFYSDEDGVWFPDGGQLVSKGEVLSDALDLVFGKRVWVHEFEGDKLKIRLGNDVVSLFHTGGVLCSIGEMCRHLRFNTGMVPLDSSPHAHKLVNFRGEHTLDFGVARPTVDWDDDDELEKALQLPVRGSSMADRTMRSVPRPFEEFEHAGRLRLARVIRAAMVDLTVNDTLSDAVKEQLDRVMPQFPMMQHCFYEAHKDWDSAFMQARLIFEPCSDTGVRCQVATFKDCGDGSTGKGTLRELCEVCLGTFNGDAQLGYSAVLKQETIQTKDKEAPSEQTSNMYLAKHAWVDDFKPTKPLCTAVLRQLSGGNNITSARKHGREMIFKFRGQIILVTNGFWSPDVPFVGAGERRVTGLSFDVRFVDDATGPNEMLKDSNIKEALRDYFAEFWFLVRVFWLVEQPYPKSDCTMPKCPNTLALAEGIMGAQFENYTVDEDTVKEFIEQKLIVYVLNEEKPSSASDIDLAVGAFVRQKFRGFSDNSARSSLRKHIQYKAGHTINKRGKRAKSTVNVYLCKSSEPYTLAPPTTLVFS